MRIEGVLERVKEEQRQLQGQLERFEELKEVLHVVGRDRGEGCFAERYTKLQEFCDIPFIRGVLGKMLEEQQLAGIYKKYEVKVFGGWVRAIFCCVEVWMPLERGKKVVKVVKRSDAECNNVLCSGDLLRLLGRQGDLGMFQVKGWEIVKQGYSRKEVGGC